MPGGGGVIAAAIVEGTNADGGTVSLVDCGVIDKARGLVLDCSESGRKGSAIEADLVDGGRVTGTSDAARPVA